MPHPVYGWMIWVAVLNPVQKAFDDIQPLVETAYAKAKKTFSNRVVD
jgi:hypothetical protein